MRKLIIFLAFASGAFANQRVSGYCQQGNNAVVTNAVPSTTLVQRSFPRCTITVYATGTLTPSTIYSDNMNTSLSNPFTAAADGSWFFYAANGRYDVTMSGGQGGGIPAPVTIGDILLQDNAAGGTITSVTGATGITCNTVSGAVTCSGSFTNLAGTISAGQIPNTIITPAMLNGVQGNGSKTQLSTGSTTTNDCVKFDVNGNTVDAGAACSSGGSTLPSATNQITYLGVSPNSGNVTTFAWRTIGPTVYASDYNFSAQTPGGTLTASVGATVTLSPCPLGVAGGHTVAANLPHLLRITGGTGTAESVAITGGTCAGDGINSGTIQFTPANNHSGAWTIIPNANGIQEAIYAAGATGSVRLQCSNSIALQGNISGVAAVNIPDGYSTSIHGCGTQNTILVPQGTTGDWVKFAWVSASGGLAIDVGDFSIQGGSLASSGSYLKVQKRGVGYVNNLALINCYTCVSVESMGGTTYDHIYIDTGGVGGFLVSCQDSVGSCNSGGEINNLTANTLANNTIELLITDYVAGITINNPYLGGGGGTSTTGIQLLSTGSNPMHEIVIHGGIIDAVTNAINIVGLVGTVSHNAMVFNGVRLTPSTYGIVTNNTVSNLLVNGGYIGTGPGSGNYPIYLTGPSQNIRIIGTTLDGNANYAFNLTGTTSSYIDIINTACGLTASFATSCVNWGASDTTDHVRVIGNDFAPSGVSGMTASTAWPTHMFLSGNAGLRVAFGALNGCTAETEGSTVTVTDSNTVTWGANVAGGSSSIVQTACNGSNYTVIGK